MAVHAKVKSMGSFQKVWVHSLEHRLITFHPRPLETMGSMTNSPGGISRTCMQDGSFLAPVMFLFKDIGLSCTYKLVSLAPLELLLSWQLPQIVSANGNGMLTI